MSSRTVLRMAERGEVPIAQKLPGVNGPHLFDADEIQALALKWATADRSPTDQLELEVDQPRPRKAS